MFNVATVHVDSGGSLVVDGAGALTVTGRGEDAGSLTVGDEDEADSLVSEAAPATSSSIVAGRLVLDRFGAVRVRRGGAVRATSYVTDETQDDAQCSSTRCPAYVFGEEEESSGFIFSNSAGEALGREALAADDAVPCQAGAMSPFALQLCHGGAVDVDGGGVVSASAVHVYGVGEVRVGRGALHADAAGCRAGEGEGRGESFAGGAGAGGGYGGAGGDGFTPDGSGSVLTYSNGTIARGGAAYGDAAAPCAASAARAGSLGSGGGAGASAGYGGAGGGLLVVGAARRPAAALIVGAGGRLSANGGDGGKAVAALTGVAAGAAEGGADGSDTLAGLGYGGGGAGGSVLVFARAFAVDAGGRVAADGGAGAGAGSAAGGGGGGGGGGRVHLEWARDGASGANAPAAPAANRTAPEGTVTADGGGGGAETRAKLGAAPALAASEASPTRGAAGTVTASACAPGFAGLLCAPCLPGTYKEGTGNGACSPCAPIPRRAVFVDPARGAPGAGGATSRACPYECVGGGERLVFPACATRAEAAVAAVGGPAAAGAALAAVVLCAALPLAAVVGRARAAERRALGRGGGRRAPQRFGSGFFPDGSRLARGAFASASAASGLATPFLRRSRDSPRAGGAARGRRRTATPAAPAARASRARFSAGCTSPARTRSGTRGGCRPRPPAVQPLLHAEEWARLVRACATGAPASWGAGQRSSRRARFPETRGSPRPGDPDETRREAVRRFGGASRARWRGAVDAILGALFAPGQTWWRERERRRVAACLDTLLDAYDRRCLRSARARALQEGLAFGCSDDARVAWLDFFAQGDEEDAFPSFPTSSAEASAEDRTARARRRDEGRS